MLIGQTGFDSWNRVVLRRENGVSLYHLYTKSYRKYQVIKDTLYFINLNGQLVFDLLFLLQVTT